MDIRQIEEALTEQQQELKRMSLMNFCTRREEALVNIESRLAQVVIGVRRSGKSTLCYNVLRKSRKKFAYVNFDDERLTSLAGKDLNNVLEILYKIYGDFHYLFIDEIQNIPEWFLFVNRLLRQGIHIVVTGSNAKLLSGELATHLTGRHRQIELYPFSFADYCDYKKVDVKTFTTKARAFRRAAFDEYMKQGGFPELLHETNATDYINTLLDSILIRDIKNRYKIRFYGSFSQLANHLLNNLPAKLEYTELQKLFNIKSDHTVENYIGYLKQAYLILGLHKYSAKSRIRVRNEKGYAIDVALMNNRSDAFAGDNLGWRLETMVYIELLRRYRPMQYDIYYYAETSGEADFVVCQGNRAKIIFQVSYDISETKTRKREIKGLLLASKATKCENLWLITDHEREEFEEEGKKIHVIPAYEWMLYI